MKSSLIVTVYNEEDSIRSLIESILEQSKRPDEVVIVDGGSNDNTQEIIGEFSEKYSWIRIHVEPGCNISEGRNKAIEMASHEVILGTDAGCTLDSKWVEKMLEEFEEGAKAVTGLWKPQYSNKFEMVQGKIRGGYIERGEIPENFPPSGKSIGFTRKVWKEAGGFPENLQTAEDAKFATKVRDAGFEWVVADAWVYWEMRSSWKEYWKQFYRYGYGDAEAGNLLNYPGKIFGISKVLLRTSTTFVAILGVVFSMINPLMILFAGAGLLPQYLSKFGSLRSCLEEGGLTAGLLWLVMIPFESLAHLSGFVSGKKDVALGKILGATRVK